MSVRLAENCDANSDDRLVQSLPHDVFHNLVRDS